MGIRRAMTATTATLRCTPGADEFCDGLDNNRDGSSMRERPWTEEFFADADGDGFGASGVSVLAVRRPTDSAFPIWTVMTRMPPPTPGHQSRAKRRLTATVTVPSAKKTVTVTV